MESRSPELLQHAPLFETSIFPPNPSQNGSPNQNGNGDHRARNIAAIVVGAIALALVAAAAVGAVIYFHAQATSADKVNATLAADLDRTDTARAALSGKLGEANAELDTALSKVTVSERKLARSQQKLKAAKKEAKAQYKKGYSAGQSAGAASGYGLGLDDGSALTGSAYNRGYSDGYYEGYAEGYYSY